MVITQLEESEKKKVRVSIDYEYAFTLSIREMRMYGLKLEIELSQKVYDEIIQEVILPRAKQKALALLKYRDRTEHELLSKLVTSGFSKEVSKEALAYVKKFNYVNDDRYASNFIQSKKSYKSLKMMQIELIKKGLSKEQIQAVVEDEYDSSIEEEVVRKEVIRRLRGIEILTYEKRMKIAAALYRKGYSSDLIRKVLEDHSIKEGYEEID